MSHPEAKGLIRLIRRKMILTLRMDDFTVLIDGRAAGVVRNGQTVEFPVAAGKHQLQLASQRAKAPLNPDALGHLHASRPLDFVDQDGQVAEFLCGPGAAAGFPLGRVKGEEKPNIMLKPKPPQVSWRTWRTYGN